MPTGDEGGVLERSKQIIVLEIGIVREDFIDRHTGGHEFKENLDRVAKATNGGPSVADCWVRRDARQPTHPASWNPARECANETNQPCQST